MSRFAVTPPAAGRSSRFEGREKKPFANLDGRAVWLRSVELFVTRADVCQCLIVVAPNDQEMFRRRYGANLAFMNVQIANGGNERFQSFAKATETGAALLGVPVRDTLKKVSGQQKVESTMPRQGLWLAQTPQVFRRD